MKVGRTWCSVVLLAASVSVAAPDSEAIGALTVLSEPESALVFVDGKLVGKTPVKIDSLTAGRHRLQLTLEGYMGKAATVEIGESGEHEVSFKLIRPAALVVLANVAGARVSIDTVDIGEVPVNRQGLKPGPYELTITAEGFKESRVTVTLSEGVTDTVSVVLEADTEKPAVPVVAPVVKPRNRRPKIATFVAAGCFTLFALLILILDNAAD